jgi:hypothetical protein
MKYQRDDATLHDTLRAAVIYFLNNGADGFMTNPRSFEYRFPTFAEEQALESIGPRALFCPDKLTAEDQDAFKRASSEVVGR